MPRYRFDGDHETVLMGLAHGVNADVLRVGEDGEPVDFTDLAGSTVVALNGDEITTSEPYLNAWMTDLDADAFAVGEQGPELRKFPAGAVVRTAEETSKAVARRKPRKPRTTTQTPTADPASTPTDPEGEE